MRLNASSVFDTDTLPLLDPSLLDDRTYDARDQFGDVFDLLLETRALPLHKDLHQTSLMDKRIAAQLQSQLHTHQAQLQAFPRHAQYSRHIIGSEGDWVAYLCRWEPHVSSCIHGHPCFAYYQVYDGEFLMDLYEVRSSGVVEHSHCLSMKNGDSIWKQGKTNCYDNMVHSVSTKDKGGFTLHLFSENPALGLHFEVS